MWGDWAIGPCSKTCGGGTRYNHRSKQTIAEYGGSECYNVYGQTAWGDHEMSIEDCNTQQCPGKYISAQLDNYNFLFDL